MNTLSTATRSDSLLRLAMRADAVLSGLCGIALVAAAGPLSGFTGLPKSVEYGIGAAFVVYATVVFIAAGLERVRPAGIATAVANLLFTVPAVVVVLERPVALTTAGVVALLGGGVYTLVFADLQYLGVRRIKGKGVPATVPSWKSKYSQHPVGPPSRKLVGCPPRASR